MALSTLQSVVLASYLQADGSYTSLRDMPIRTFMLNKLDRIRPRPDEPPR